MDNPVLYKLMLYRHSFSFATVSVGDMYVAVMHMSAMDMFKLWMGPSQPLKAPYNVLVVLV